MAVIGITGPIGSGKSFLAQLFEEKGWAILDVDAVAKPILQEVETVRELLEFFGPTILNSEGHVDPTILGKRVFSDKNELAQLNAVMHPKIFHTVKKLVQLEPKNLVIHAALLFQIELDTLCSLILSLHVDDHTLQERVMGRSTYLNEILFQKILIQQKTHNDFWNRSDIIMDNNRTPKELKKKFERLYSQLKEG